MWGLGACPVKIMILEVRFLLTNFDSTSAIFKTLYLALNKINYYSENLGGGCFGLWGDIPGSPPEISLLLTYSLSKLSWRGKNLE